MIQRFTPVIQQDAVEFWSPSFLLGYPLKSYLFSSACTNIVYRNLYGEAFSVAWIGENSKFEVIKQAFKEIDPVLYGKFCETAEVVPDEPALFSITNDFNMKMISVKHKSFLFNLSKNEYLDLSHFKNDELDPLVYLTAVSCAGTDPGFPGLREDFVDGRWAFDTIILTETRPTGTEINLSQDY